MRHLTHLSAAALAVFALTIPACEADRSATPTDVSPPERLTPEELRRSTVSGDSVYWIDNYAAWEDDDTGDFWEWEREGSNGYYPVARLYKNGVYLGRVEMEYNSSGDPVADTMVTPEGHWADRVEDGDILHAEPYTDGDMPKIESTEPSKAGFGFGLQSCLTTVASVFLDGRCDSEYDEMLTASRNAAIGGTLGTVLNIVSGGAFLPYTGTAMAVATANALSKLGQWAACMIS